MKCSIKYTDEEVFRERLSWRNMEARALKNVPYSALANEDIRVRDYLETMDIKLRDGGRKRVRIKHQLEMLDAAIANPRSVGLLAIGALRSLELARGVAAKVYRTAHNNRFRNRPKWHYVTSSFYDPLLERDPHGGGGLAAVEPDPSLLVLDGLYADSNNVRLEKTRDLIFKYREDRDSEDSIPIILLIAGTNPLDFVQDRLFCRISGAIYLSRKIEHWT